MVTAGGRLLVTATERNAELAAELRARDLEVSRLQAEVDQIHLHPSERHRTIYRVRWWRPSWAGGRASANSRLFLRRASAERLARRLTATAATEAAGVIVEVEACPAGPFAPVDWWPR